MLYCKSTDLEIKGIEELHLPGGGGARVGEVAVVAVDAERAQTAGVGRRVADGVQNLNRRQVS